MTLAGPGAGALKPPLGDLMAEGGEGRVYRIEGRPADLYKAYKVPVARAPLDALVAWPAQVARGQPDLAARATAATAWPAAVVAASDHALADGVVMPCAPDRFWLRHRDGARRLASLSYLTADPAQRAAAYGLVLPPPAAADRFALAYALARLLDALARATPAAGHGDLSAKNVLWSLERGPEVWLIDCDNTELFGPDGSPLAGGRRRPMTPNWDDPSVPAGTGPGLASDRYSLALIFVRIVGAAHFPIQVRQRRGETVPIDFELPGPARRLPSLGRAAPLWRLVARGLSLADPSARPCPAEWAGALEAVLTEMGSAPALSRVWAAQEGLELAQPSPPPPAAAPAAPADVFVRPVSSTPRRAAWRLVSAGPAPGADTEGEEGAPVVVRRFVRYCALWWWLAHRGMVRSLVMSGHHLAGARRLVFLLLVDLAAASVALFLFAMIVSPFLGL